MATTTSSTSRSSENSTSIGSPGLHQRNVGLVRTRDDRSGQARVGFEADVDVADLIGPQVFQHVLGNQVFEFRRLKARACGVSQAKPHDARAFGGAALHRSVDADMWGGEDYGQRLLHVVDAGSLVSGTEFLEFLGRNDLLFE